MTVVCACSDVIRGQPRPHRGPASSTVSRKMATDERGDYGHANKKQKIDDGYIVQSGSRDKSEDPHKPSPSPVVHVRSLSENVIEADIVEAVQHFGPISYVIMMPKKRQALVEFEDIDGAESCVKFAQTNQCYVGGAPAYFNYSTSQKISRPGRQRLGNGTVGHNGPEDTRNANHILLFTILNPTYPITTDVMYTICSPCGAVQRIVIFKKNGVQAMVEFDNIGSAQKAKASLNGADIYSGCCTLKIEYAKPTKLNVHKNDSETWDYTNPNLGSGGGDQQPRKNQGPLLRDPPPQYGNGRGGAGPPNFGNQEFQNPGYHNPPGQHGGFGNQGHPPNQGYNNQFNQGQNYQPLQQDQQFGGQGQYGPPMGGPGGGNMGPPPQQRQPPSYSPGPPQPGPGGPGPQGSPVVMVYGMVPNKMNCERLFNLLCLYGNVMKIKFMKSKPGSAMVQMGDPSAVERCINNLSTCVLFGQQLALSYSRQKFIDEKGQPFLLEDGTSSYTDFTNSKNNRFSTPEAAAKNRIQQPSKVLHFFNAPPDATEESLRQLTFSDAGVPPPTAIKMFQSRRMPFNAGCERPRPAERSSSGLLEWDKQSDALEALVICNHSQMASPKGRYPFTLKLCFSAAIHAV
ncbi:heterogeneous nuclear ribonucleoprotein L-like isoform X1 [Branchiostoma floridae]|uniref:Heterogeneous nuclear ribonucleoprotein L-like isoform X1 n=1 Tax=Branchiostoma floridae TaxID=7739 RepID=A0A9J7M980_BRAFL|nr:heterogeneous nuclear ribonucleoprotein L-like isoform X1 [Branchiostoma floridae]